MLTPKEEGNHGGGAPTTNGRAIIATVFIVDDAGEDIMTLGWEKSAKRKLGEVIRDT
jgi:hypothetical protein